MTTEPNIVAKIIEFFSLLLNNTKLIISLFIFCLIMLFIPKYILTFFSIEIVLKFRWLFGIIFFVCAALLIPELYSSLKMKFQVRSEKKGVLKRLNTLGAKESEYLLDRMKNNEQTIPSVIDDLTAQGLVEKGIVRIGPIITREVNFIIEDYVWKYLNNHQKYYYKMFTEKMNKLGE